MAFTFTATFVGCHGVAIDSCSSDALSSVVPGGDNPVFCPLPLGLDSAFTAGCEIVVLAPGIGPIRKQSSPSLLAISSKDSCWGVVG